MKKLIIPAMMLLCAAPLWVNTIYSFSVPAGGSNQPLSVYEGKKILVITLPVERNATTDSMLYALDTLSAAHTSTLKVIAVPPIEYGYMAQSDSLDAWYHSKLGNQVLITDGMFTRKASGTSQHPLFKWLTNADENSHFDIDADGPGYKFFTNGSGHLYGVLHPATKMWSGAVQKILAQ